MPNLKQRDIDRIYNALRPRIGSGGGGGGTVVVTIPPHTHSADQIGSTAAGDVAAVNVQAAVEELAEEKLARDGHQPMTGNLDLDHHDVSNVNDLEVESDISMSGGVGAATINPRKITMVGAEADGEARVEAVKALAFDEVSPSAEYGRVALDAAEGTLVVYVASGAGMFAAALGWVVKLAFNAYNPA